jgi:urease gamma subunit
MLLFTLQFYSFETVTTYDLFFIDDMDKIIFLNTFKMIERKILNGIKINLSETIWYYCGFIVRKLALGKTNFKIQTDLPKQITNQMVMIGVSEIVQKLVISLKHNKGSVDHYFVLEPPIS